MKKLIFVSSFSLLVISSGCFLKKSTATSTNTTSQQNTQTDVCEPIRDLALTEGLNVGNLAPDISELNTDGQELKLSNLRTQVCTDKKGKKTATIGKMVLIDFWASWCGPCRRENPNVVKSYNTYKDLKFKNGNGFTIFSVSLDQEKAKWLAAIQKDGLVWPTHVSDLKGWYSAAGQKYGVNSIPSNVLLDANGVILGRNLMGKALEDALKANVVN